MIFSFKGGKMTCSRFCAPGRPRLRSFWCRVMCVVRVDGVGVAPPVSRRWRARAQIAVLSHASTAGRRRRDSAREIECLRATPLRTGPC